jgi:membrane protease YdiL (CAAX protease family)
MTGDPERSPSATTGRLAAAAGLLIALVLPFIPLGNWLAPGSSIPARLAHEAVWWAYAAVIVGWLMMVERKTLSSIGFRAPTWKTAAFGLLTGLATIAILIAQYAVIVPLLHLDGSHAGDVRAKIMETPYWYRVLMVLRAAVVEELMFRAYMMEKVRQLTGSWGLALVVSVTAFTLAHLGGWGLVHLIPVFGAAVVFGLMYLWRRDTPANMIGHFLADAAGFLTG